MATVLIFHSNFQTLPGAWASLGLFFVLSGFLITAMLVGEHQRTRKISLKNFYSRRAFRLLPPLFIAVALLGIYAGFVHVFDAVNTLWADAAAAVFYFADYRSALGHEPTIAYLSQSWSLAVEEQFYLIWAVLLFVALRNGSRRAAYGIAIVGVLAAVANRMYIVMSAPHWDRLVAARTYYAFDTRADALFLGCLLGLVATGGHLDNWGPAAKRLVSVAALASTAAMFWIYFNVSLAERSLPLLWLPVSEVAALGIIVFLVIHSRSLSARVLSLPLLVLLGNMSYAVYVYHWPVYVALSPFTVRWPFWAYETVRLAIIMTLAFASWYLVEQPLMEWRRKRFASGGPEAATKQASEARIPAAAPP
jgi:peptidoglycan/LPS O-acetylase OafA/YrhL